MIVFGFEGVMLINGVFMYIAVVESFTQCPWFRPRATLNPLYSWRPSSIISMLHYRTWMAMIIFDSSVHLTHNAGLKNAFVYTIKVTLYWFVQYGHLPAAILNIWNCSSINRISKISGEMWQKPSKNISHTKNPGRSCLTLVGILTRKLWYTLTSAWDYIMYDVLNGLHLCVNVVFLDTENIVEIVDMLRSGLEVKLWRNTTFRIIWRPSWKRVIHTTFILSLLDFLTLKTWG